MYAGVYIHVKVGVHIPMSVDVCIYIYVCIGKFLLNNFRRPM